MLEALSKQYWDSYLSLGMLYSSTEKQDDKIIYSDS